MSFNSLVENLSEILKESGNLYSYSACVIIVLTIFCFLSYRFSSGKERNRAFYFTLLCLMGIAFATLTAGLLGGFQKGERAGLEQGIERTQEEIQQDPSVVTLSDSSARILNNLIVADGGEVNSESKSLMTEKSIRAFSEYIESGAVGKPSWIREKEGFVFNFQGCSRKLGSTDVFCNILVTNKEADRSLNFYLQSNNDKSIIIDSQGGEYNTRDAEFGSEPDYSGWRVSNTLPTDIEIGVWFKFENVPTEIDQLQVARFEFYAEQSQKLDIDYRDISIET